MHIYAYIYTYIYIHMYLVDIYTYWFIYIYITATPEGVYIPQGKASSENIYVISCIYISVSASIDKRSRSRSRYIYYTCKERSPPSRGRGASYSRRRAGEKLSAHEIANTNTDIIVDVEWQNTRVGGTPYIVRGAPRDVDVDR